MTQVDQSISKKPRNMLLRLLGPGLVTGAADDDPSGIATYSQAGAQRLCAMALSRRSHNRRLWNVRSPGAKQTSYAEVGMADSDPSRELSAAVNGIAQLTISF